MIYVVVGIHLFLETGSEGGRLQSTNQLPPARPGGTPGPGETEHEIQISCL